MCRENQGSVNTLITQRNLVMTGLSSQCGDGFEEGTTMGPINNQMQFDRVIKLVEDAKKACTSFYMHWHTPCTSIFSAA